MIYLLAILTGLILGWFLSKIEEGQSEGTIDWTEYFIAISGALFGVILFNVVLGIRLTAFYVNLEAILWSLLGVLIVRLILALFTFTDEELEMLQKEGVFAQEYKPKKRKSKK